MQTKTRRVDSQSEDRDSYGRFRRENSRQRYRDYDTDYDVEGEYEYDDENDYGSRGEYGREYDDDYYRKEREYNDYDYDERGGRGRQGFASMDREEVREIASRGGRASHGGSSYNYDSDDYSRGRSLGRRTGSSQGRRSGSSGRGFASMDREEVREIARKGGKASHGGGRGGSYTSRSNNGRSSSSSSRSGRGGSRSSSSRRSGR